MVTSVANKHLMMDYIQVYRVAACNMVGKEEVVFSSIPYFWTVLFGKSLRYCGGHYIEYYMSVC